MTHPRERIQIDVKYVPRACIDPTVKHKPFKYKALAFPIPLMYY